MLPSLNAVRAFDAVARHMSFQSAANEMNLTPSAISYQIRQLEEQLSVKLFTRHNREIELTREGAQIAPAIRDAFVTLEVAFAALGQQENSNKLVISTGPAFSAKWLAPRLHEYLELYPEIDFRLSASLRLVDFEADGVDAAVRFGEGNYKDLYLEPIFNETLLPMISPERLNKVGGRADASILKQVPLLHDDSMPFLSEKPGWRGWLDAAGYSDVDSDAGPRFSHGDHGLEAAVDGGGIVLGRLSLAFRDLMAGRLVAPFNVALQFNAGFYICLPEENLKKEKVLNFIAWLRDAAHEQNEAMEAFLKTKRVVRFEAG